MSDRKLEDYFEFKCWKGLKQKSLDSKPEYVERLKYEIAAIKKMGFPGYFLIVTDFLNWARKNNIPVGPGRGSAAGSLVAYCLNITSIDPIKFDLLFERFINPDRISMPDIDCDFCEKRRDEVIQYVINKYGKDHVAQIGTFGTMKAKGAIRDVARTLGVDLSVADKLSKLIPPPVHGKPIPLSESYKQVPELSAYHKSDTPEGAVLRWSDKLEGTIRSFGTHASGVVISPEAIYKSIPLATGKDGTQATQFEMNTVEEVGLIKFDFLGLRTLTLIRAATDLIKKHHNVDVDIENLPTDDDAVYQKLREGDTCGIFQLETSSGMRSLLVAIAPTQLEDLIALVAMYRPGPLGSDGMRMYLDVRAGKINPSYPFPELEEILHSTSGWIIYQEQVMKMAVKLAGYSPGMADDLRKAIGKKKEKEMARHREIFIEGAVKNGYDRERVTKLYSEIEDFGAYGFNKSHAAAYAYIAYQTAWLKTHYPVEFMCAALTCDYESTDKVIKYIAECKRLGIEILPPDINESDAGFTVAERTGTGSRPGAIRFGLSAIKNLGPEPISYITSVRGDGFKDIIDFASRVDLSKINKKKLESLVLAGAFDTTGSTRTSMLAAIDAVIEHKQEVKRYEAKMLTFNKKQIAYMEREAARETAKNNSLKVPASLKEPVAPEVPANPTTPDLPEMDEHELLSHEKEVLGFFISGHPLDSYSSALKDASISSVESLPELQHGSFVHVAGIVEELEEKRTKRGDLMAFASLEDKSSKVEVVFFSGVYAKHKEAINSGKPVKVSGKLEIIGAGEEEEQVVSLTAKIIVFDVAELAKGTIRYEPIEITLDPIYASKVDEILKKYPGNDHQVNLSFKTTDGTIFKSTKLVYSIGGNRNAFIREVGKVTS